MSETSDLMWAIGAKDANKLSEIALQLEQENATLKKQVDELEKELSAELGLIKQVESLESELKEYRESLEWFHKNAYQAHRSFGETYWVIFQDPIGIHQGENLLEAIRGARASLDKSNNT